MYGPALPVKHVGSVDVFLQVLAAAAPGDVLVIDNAGRHDEGCIGDLIGLEAKQRGVAGILVWGRHRDTAELCAIGIPVFSLGACPAGPRRLDPRPDDVFTCAEIGDVRVTRAHYLAADADGVLVLPLDRMTELRSAATEIGETETAQATRLQSGQFLYEQLRLDEYLARAAADPGSTFREHLRAIGGAVEG